MWAEFSLALASCIVVANYGLRILTTVLAIPSILIILIGLILQRKHQDAPRVVHGHLSKGMNLALLSLWMIALWLFAWTQSKDNFIQGMKAAWARLEPQLMGSNGILNFIGSVVLVWVNPFTVIVWQKGAIMEIRLALDALRGRYPGRYSTFNLDRVRRG